MKKEHKVVTKKLYVTRVSYQLGTNLKHITFNGICDDNDIRFLLSNCVDANIDSIKYRYDYAVYYYKIPVKYFMAGMQKFKFKEEPYNEK